MVSNTHTKTDDPFEKTPKITKWSFDPDSGIPGRGDLRISLTTACDRMCAHCHNEGSDAPWKVLKQELELQEIESLIAHANQYGVNTITYSGGDPGAYTKFDELMEFTAGWKEEYGSIHKWAICTNGGPFLNAKRFQALADSKLNHATFGIDSVEPGELSKPSSLEKGNKKTGTEIIEKVVKPLLEAWPDRSFKFDTVFTAANDIAKTRAVNVIRFAMWLGINVSVIEVNGVMGEAYHVRSEFIRFIQEVAKEFGFDMYHYVPLREVYLYDKNGKARIKFYPDHCASRDCHTCGLVHMRVGPSAEGMVGHPCFLQSRKNIKLMDDNGAILTSAWDDFIRLNGAGPDWIKGTVYDEDNAADQKRVA